MAHGDVGGPVTELIITCKAPATGTVSIAKGDAVKLTGTYTVDNMTDAEDAVFGQAMGSVRENGATLPVKVRGICVFAYYGKAPVVNGVAGIVAGNMYGNHYGYVKAPSSGNGSGVNLKVDGVDGCGKVHVLL